MARSNKIHLVVTPQEKEMLNMKAKLENLSLSNYIRVKIGLIKTIYKKTCP